MSTRERLQRQLRGQAEHHLLEAAQETHRREHPEGTVAPNHPPAGWFWRVIFVPVYRRLPWGIKRRAMHALRMTADFNGWTAPDRRPGEPWQPPATPAPPARPAQHE
jgi:hypothetical protein